MTVYVDNGAVTGERRCMLFAGSGTELADFAARLCCRTGTVRVARRLAIVALTCREADRAILFGAIPVDWQDTPRLHARARGEETTS